MLNETCKAEPGIQQNQSLIRNKKSKLYHVFNFLAEEYDNNTEKMLSRINSILALSLASEFIKNKTAKKIIRGLKTGLVATMFGTELIMHLKNYIEKQRQEKESPYNKKMEKISKILGISKSSHPNGVDYHLNIDMAMWLLKSPQTSKFKIKKYYNMASFEEIQEVDIDKTNDIGILIEFNTIEILLIVVIRVLSDIPMINESLIFSESFNGSILEDFSKSILFEYTQKLDIKRNIIKFDQMNYLIAKPRRSISEKINQFDVDSFIEEMKQVLYHGRKRAFAFVGRQGVGKSSILRVIEEKMTDYMVLHLTPEDFDNASTITRRFEIAKMFQPLIIIIEDLDSCGLKTKNTKTGAFLDCIDDVNKDLHAIILVTINDTGMVHQTIINRPGRFDRVFEVMPPETTKEAYEVIQSKISSLIKDYCGGYSFILPENPTKDMENNLESCLKYKFTQADLTSAVTEQVFIDINIDGLVWSNVTPEIFDAYFKKSIEKHLATKKAINAFKFNSEIGDNLEEYSIQTEVKAAKRSPF